MTPLETFKAKLDEYATNNISALQGKIQITLNEREDLKRLFLKLDDSDRPKALELAHARGLETSGWK